MLRLGFGISVLLCLACQKTGDLGDDVDSNGDTNGDDSPTSGAGDDAETAPGDDGGGCGPDDCGPAPGAPNYLCDDCVTYGGPGPCVQNEDGTCGWSFNDCTPAEEGTCDDPTGSTGGDDCDCALGAYVPACGVDGMTYDATCGTHCVPVEIECLGSECPCPEKMCCDPIQMPDCPDPIHCCADGSWLCGQPGSTADDCAAGPGMACDGGQCIDQGGSCAAGETCCAGLECCGGVPVPPGQEFCGNTCPISDRNKKENFELVDTQQILDKVITLPITTWNYRDEDPSVRHIGPMAQDFKATFRVGATDKSIFVVDADGVALASIQALHGKLREAEATNAALRAELDALEQRLQALEAAAP